MKLKTILQILAEAPNSLPVYFDFCELIPSNIINCRLDVDIALGIQKRQYAFPQNVTTLITEIRIGANIYRDLTGKSATNELLFVGDNESKKFKTIVNGIRVLNTMVILKTVAVHKLNPNKTINGN